MVEIETENNLKYPFEFKTWRPKNIRDSVLPILVLNWLMGLCIIEYPLGKPQHAFTFIYVFLANTIYWLVKYYHRHELKQKNLSTMGNNIFTFVMYANIFIAIISILIGWYRYKVLKANIEKLELFDEALKRLGVQNNYRKIFIHSLLRTIFWFFIVIILIINDVQNLITIYDWLTSLRVTYLIHCPLQLNSVVDITFTTFVNCIEMRFKNINLLLERSISKYQQPETIRETYSKYNRVKNVKSTESCLRINDNQEQIKILTIARHLHMELSRISLEINKIYQIQVALEVGSYFAIVTGLLYNLFMMIFFSKKNLHEKIRNTISIALWCGVYVFRLFKLNSACASVSKESSRANEIIYELKNSNENEELKEEIEQFSLQLTQRPLNFIPCGLITLNYTFIQRFIGSVTTHLVILIQMSPEMNE